MKKHVTIYLFFPSDWSVNKILRWYDQRKELMTLKPESYWTHEKLAP